MALQPVGPIERFATRLADVAPFVGVLGLMQFQIGFAQKRFAAKLEDRLLLLCFQAFDSSKIQSVVNGQSYLADKLLVVQMDFHVHFQHRFAGKKFQTNIALMLFLFFHQMRLMVCLACALCGESLLANAAFVRLEAQMTVLMVDQTLLCLEAHAAHRTLVRPIGVMCLHMDGEVAFDLEALAADIACVLEFAWRVDRHVCDYMLCRII